MLADSRTCTISGFIQTSAIRVLFLPVSLLSPEASPEMIPSQPLTHVSHLQTEAASPIRMATINDAVDSNDIGCVSEPCPAGALASDFYSAGTWNILNPPCTWVSCFVQEFNCTIYKVHVYPLKELRTILSHASWSTYRKPGPDGYHDLLNLTHECCQDSELWLLPPCSLLLYLSPPTVGGDL